MLIVLILFVLSLQGKVLREKESRNVDWKQKITKNIMNTGEVLKKHANKVSNKVRQWWRGKKAAFKKTSKASKTEL